MEQNGTWNGMECGMDWNVVVCFCLFDTMVYKAGGNCSQED